MTRIFNPGLVYAMTSYRYSRVSQEYMRHNLSKYNINNFGTVSLNLMPSTFKCLPKSYLKNTHKPSGISLYTLAVGYWAFTKKK